MQTISHWEPCLLLMGKVVRDYVLGAKTGRDFKSSWVSGHPEAHTWMGTTTDDVSSVPCPWMRPHDWFSLTGSELSVECYFPTTDDVSSLPCPWMRPHDWFSLTGSELSVECYFHIISLKENQWPFKSAPSTGGSTGSFHHDGDDGKQHGRNLGFGII